MIYFKTPSFYKKSSVVFDCNCTQTVKFPLFYYDVTQISSELICGANFQIYCTSHCQKLCCAEPFHISIYFFTIFILMNLLVFQVASDCCSFHEVSLQISNAINIYLSAYLFSVTNLNSIINPQNENTI